MRFDCLFVLGDWYHTWDKMLRIQWGDVGNKRYVRVILFCYVFIVDIAVSSYYTISVNRTKSMSCSFLSHPGKTLSDGLESNVLYA